MSFQAELTSLTPPTTFPFNLPWPRATAAGQGRGPSTGVCKRGQHDTEHGKATETPGLRVLQPVLGCADCYRPGGPHTSRMPLKMQPPPTPHATPPPPRKGIS